MVRLERHTRYGAQVAALALLALGTPAVGASAADRFTYDASAPLDVETKAFRENGIRVKTIAFASPRGGRATGWLVTPPGHGKFAGLVFTHSQGPLSFLPDALLLARTGAVSLLLDLPPSNEEMSPQMEQAVVNIRRAADLLSARTDVDPKRLGYVGHSYGAMMGAVAAGVDHRFRCFVFEVGLLGMSYHLRTSPHPWPRSVRESMPKEKFDALIERIRPFDADDYIGNAAPAALLFQSARFDPGVPESDAQAFYDRASQPKELKWYDCAHDANDLAVPADRARFLGKQLGLRDVDVILRAKVLRAKGR